MRFCSINIQNIQVDLQQKTHCLSLPCCFVWAINKPPLLRLTAESICLYPFIYQPACLVACLPVSVSVWLYFHTTSLSLSLCPSQHSDSLRIPLFSSFPTARESSNSCRTTQQWLLKHSKTNQITHILSTIIPMCTRTVHTHTQSTVCCTCELVSGLLHSHKRTWCKCDAAPLTANIFAFVSKWSAKATHLHLAEPSGVFVSCRLVLQVNRKPSPHREFSRAGIHGNEQISLSLPPLCIYPIMIIMSPAGGPRVEMDLLLVRLFVSQLHHWSILNAVLVL